MIGLVDNSSEWHWLGLWCNGAALLQVRGEIAVRRLDSLLAEDVQVGGRAVQAAAAGAAVKTANTGNSFGSDYSSRLQQSPLGHLPSE